MSDFDSPLERTMFYVLLKNHDFFHPPMGLDDFNRDFIYNPHNNNTLACAEAVYFSKKDDLLLVHLLIQKRHFYVMVDLLEKKAYVTPDTSHFYPGFVATFEQHPCIEQIGVANPDLYYKNTTIKCS